MRRPSTAFVDPAFFSSGNIGRQTATNDVYFSVEGDEATRIILDDFVNLLPEWQRSAVQMTVMANMTYQEASEKISVLRGKRTDKKTVWRWAVAGVETLKEWLSSSKWVGAMTNGKIPVDFLDDSKDISVPWRD